MSDIIYINQQFVPRQQAVVSVEDRGYVFADGVYEVMCVQQGHIFHFEQHMARLKQSLAGIKLAYEIHKQELEWIIKELLVKNHLTEGVVYLQITRGVAPRNHAFPVNHIAPSLWMMVSKFPVLIGEEYDNGVAAITYPDLRWKRRDLKTISLLPNVLAKQEAIEKQAVESILYEENQQVTEGSSTNIFMVDAQETVWTHPANHLVLPGITRYNVISVLRQHAVNVREEAFTLEQLKEAKEVFMTSTTKRILSITQIDHHNVADGVVGKVTKQAMAWYNNYMEQQRQKDQ